MSSWKLGYVSGLDSVGSEDAGKALYDPWSISTLTLSSKTTRRTGGRVTGISQTTLTDTGAFVSSAFNGGFVKIRSGTAKGEVYKVTSNTSNTLTCKAGTTMVTDGVSVNDYFEVVSGATTFTFPTERNPTRKDYKRIMKGVYSRFPYYTGGISISLGNEPDDFVIMAFFQDMDQFSELGILLNNKVGFDGEDATYSGNEIAPMILEEGTHSADSQYLVYAKDYKIVKDGKMGGYIEIMIHFEETVMASYRGI